MKSDNELRIWFKKECNVDLNERELGLGMIGYSLGAKDGVEEYYKRLKEQMKVK